MTSASHGFFRGSFRRRAALGASAVTVVLLVSAVLAACGGVEDPKQSRINVIFPSTKAAVATDKLQLIVYEATDPNDCLDLVQRRRTAQDPERRAIAGLHFPVPTCDFLAAGRVPNLDLGYGRRAFLLLGQKDSEDFLIGCTLQGVGDVEQSIDIALTPISNAVQVPETTCQQLSAKCADECQ